MRSLVTGGSGFLGRELVVRLVEAGHSVDVLGRGGEATIVADLTRGPPRLPVDSYDVAFHLAGHAHRRAATDEERERFVTVNVLGTENLLAALGDLRDPPRSFVLASSVSVYGRTSGEGITEDEPPASRDPYGASKAEAEVRVREWCAAHSIRPGIARLPLVVGSDAPGNLGRIVRAIRKGWYVGLGSGRARRSMVLVQDATEGMIALARSRGTFHFTDGVHPSFREFENAIAEEVGRKPPPRMPERLGRAVAFLGDLTAGWTQGRLPLDSDTLEKMTSTLTFDDTRARRELDWAPTPVLQRVGDWVR